MDKFEDKQNDPNSPGSNQPAFLSGGGEMGQLIRDLDWSQTAIGSPDNWPQSLRTTIRLMLHTNHPMFLFWGEELTCFYNDAFSASLGPERHPSALGASGKEVWKEIWHIVEPEINPVMSGGGSTWNEHRLFQTTYHGQIKNIWWTYSLSPIDDETSLSGIGGVLVICTDVSAQHNETDALRLEQERLMGLFKHAPGFIAAVYGKDHIFDFANDAYRRLVNGRDVAGLSVREALPELEGQGFYELLDHVYESGEPFIGENLPISFQGSNDSPTETRYISFIYQPIKNQNGEVIGIIGEGQDNTESKLAEIQLRETLENNNAILENTKDLICSIDADGYFCNINNRSWDILGYEPEEIIGHHYTDFIVKEDSESVGHWLSTILQGISNSDLESRCTHKDGHVVSILWSAVWSTEQEKLFGIGKNITEWLKSEEIARHAQKSEAIGQLTGGMAHDFNNLLTVILGNAELLVEQIPRNSELQSLARMILKASERGAELTSRLLAFARQQPLAPEPVDVEKLIVGMNEFIARTLGEHIDIEFVCNMKLNLALVDESQLESALLNLCINSRDAMPKGGRLTISASKYYLDEDYATENMEVTAGNYIMISIADTGDGISTENLPKVFEPFFTTKDVGRGTGLGLSMVMGFIKQSKGHVTIHSDPGHGTVVKLFIPEADVEKYEIETPVADIIGGTETVLLTEDDDLVRHYALTQLKLLGYNVISAENGTIALNIVRERNDIDLLFTDIIMPGGVSGREVAEEAKTIRPLLKILFTSGYSNDLFSDQHTHEKKIRLLSKPYSRIQLAQSVRLAIDT